LNLVFQQVETDGETNIGTEEEEDELLIDEIHDEDGDIDDIPLEDRYENMLEGKDRKLVSKNSQIFLNRSQQQKRNFVSFFSNFYLDFMRFGHVSVILFACTSLLCSEIRIFEVICFKHCKR